MGPTRLMYKKLTEGWVPGWAASFGMAKQVGLKIGQMFVNPLYLGHESGSEVSFAPLYPTRTMPSNIVDNFWASSWPVAVHCRPRAIECLGHLGYAIVALRD